MISLDVITFAEVLWATPGEHSKTTLYADTKRRNLISF